MADFAMHVEGLEEVEAGLGALGRAVMPGGLQPVLRDCGLIAEHAIGRAFREERAPRFVADVGKAGQAAGAPWKRLAPSTLAARRGGGGGAKILRDTGALSASIDTIIGSDYVEVGTRSEIGLFQHGGTDPYTIVPKRPGGMLRFIGAGGEIVFAREVHHPGLPSRAFIGVDEEDVEAMGEATVEHLERAAE